MIMPIQYYSIIYNRVYLSFLYCIYNNSSLSRELNAALLTGIGNTHASLTSPQLSKTVSCGGIGGESSL